MSILNKDIIPTKGVSLPVYGNRCMCLYPIDKMD